MKTVIYDLDGTLIDTKEGIICALNHVLSHFDSYQISETESDLFIGPPIKESLIKYRRFNEKDALIATKMYRQVYVDKYAIKSNLYDGVIEVLELFNNVGINQCIATMKTQIQVDKILTYYNLSKYFADVKCANDQGTITKIQMIQSIKSKFDNSNSFVLIGDTKGDYDAAINSNVDFIFAKYGYGNLYLKNIHFVKNFREIKNLIINGSSE